METGFESKGLPTVFFVAVFGMPTMLPKRSGTSLKTDVKGASLRIQKPVLLSLPLCNLVYLPQHKAFYPRNVLTCTQMSRLRSISNPVVSRLTFDQETAKGKKHTNAHFKFAEWISLGTVLV